MSICPSCLSEVNEKTKFCPVCKNKLPNKYNVKKILIFTAIILLITISIFSLFLSFKNENSEEKVMNKFEKAIADRNVETIKKTVVHNDLTSITTTEAKALISLIEEIGEVEIVKLFSSRRTNQFLKPYKMKAPKTSLSHGDPNFSYKIDGANTKNLIPGFYSVDVTVLPDIAPVKDKVTSKILKPNTSIASELPIEYFDFATLGLGYVPNINVSINKKEYTLTSLINRSPLPVIINENFDYHYIITTPWGEIENDTLNTSDFTDYYWNNKYVTDDQYKEIRKDTQKFYTHLSSHTIPQSGISKNVEQLLATAEKVETINKKIIDFQIVTLSVDDNNNIDGLVSNFKVKTKTSKGSVTLFSIYDAKKKKFIIDDFLSDDFLNNDVEFSSYWLNRVSLNISNLTDDQLRASFYTLYKALIKRASFDEDAPPPKTYEEIHSMKVNDVKIINNNKVELNTSFTRQDSHIQKIVILLRDSDGSWELEK